MNAEIKPKWLAELRNPANKQTRKCLKDETGRCCLGVLCDVVGLQTWYGPAFDGQYCLGGNWYGMPSYEITNAAQLDRVHLTVLSEMNDSGQSFTQIADYIEANL